MPDDRGVSPSGHVAKVNTVGPAFFVRTRAHAFTTDCASPHRFRHFEPTRVIKIYSLESKNKFCLVPRGLLRLVRHTLSIMAHGGFHLLHMPFEFPSNNSRRRRGGRSVHSFCALQSQTLCSEFTIYCCGGCPDRSCFSASACDHSLYSIGTISSPNLFENAHTHTHTDTLLHGNGYR